MIILKFSLVKLNFIKFLRLNLIMLSIHFLYLIEKYKILRHLLKLKKIILIMLKK
jgi:hypothetical protein